MNTTKKTLLGKILPGMALLALFAPGVHAEPPREQFKHMAEQLQKTPDDSALREKVIKMAQHLKPAPAVPEEARRSFVRGNTAMGEAKSSEDYARAAKLYEESANIAPWWGDAYLNLAKANEQQENFNGAIAALKNYLLTNPPKAKAREMQDHIYALEEKRDKQAEIAAAKNREAEERRRKEQLAAEEQRRNEQQAAAVIQRVQSIVSGKQYERWVASVSNPYNSSSSGVTEAESKGSVWWGWPAGKPVQQYVIDGKNIRICFIPDGGGLSCEYGITGIPGGPNISDIVWSSEYIDGGQKKSKRIWAWFNEANGEFEFSADRPVNNSEYSPDVRYNYWWYRLYPVGR